ncbi:MAG: polysaccharide deacetylase family protein [Actinomycetota bacterium]
MGLVAGHALPSVAPLVPRLAAALRIPTRLTDPGAVAITFDDGPDPEGTAAVLSVLDRERVGATFFLVGEQVRRNPSLAAEIVAAGHAVQLHGDRHRNQLRLTPGQIRDDLQRGAEAIEEATGRATPFYRPPYGIFSAVGLRTVNRSPCEPLLWSRWGRDWRGRATGASVASDATRGLEGGDVILLHDADNYSDSECWRATASALPRIIEVVRHRGLRPIPVRGPADAKS